MVDKKDSTGMPDPAMAFRSAAEQSVAQARKAFDEAMDLTRKTVAGAESTQQQMQDRVREMTRETLDFAGAAAAATLDLFERLSRSKSPQEVVEIQKAYIEAQMERLGQQARAVGDGAIKAAQDLTKPFDR